MSTIAHTAVQVTGGVDTYKDTHTVDAAERMLGSAQFSATSAGYAALLGWLGGFGQLVLVGWRAPHGAGRSTTQPAGGPPLRGQPSRGPYVDITLGSEIFDPEGGPLSLTWFDNGVQLATGASPTVRIYGDCGDGWHHLVVRVTDDAGNTRDDAVDFGVGVLC